MPGRHTLNPGTRTVLAKTCTNCGELKQGHEFRVARGKWLQAQCARCQSKSARASNRRTNATSQDRADRNGQPWTLEEIRQLEAYLQERKPHHLIAFCMGRTLFAIRRAQLRYGLDR